MTHHPTPLLLIVCGPTASGKTALAVRLAQHFNTVILSADSRQFYRKMQIGTAAPTPEEQQGVQHYFVQHLPLDETYNASRYADDALNLLNDLFRNHRVVIVAGGSGLYINTLCYGMDPMPDPDSSIRDLFDKRLANEGLHSVRKWLRQLDPVGYSQIDLDNPKRIQRAIEVSMLTGQPWSALRTAKPQPRFFDTLHIGVHREREELFRRIELRTDQMMRDGLEQEARELLPFRHLNALQTVGYRELFEYFDGKITLAQAITNIKTNTRRYAKRQLTWFKRLQDIEWFHPDEYPRIINRVNHQLVAAGKP